MNRLPNPPEHILGASPELARLVQNHLTALHDLAAQFGLTIQTAAFALSFTEDPRQDFAAFTGCGCMICTARTITLMQRGIDYAVEVATAAAQPKHAGHVH